VRSEEGAVQWVDLSGMLSEAWLSVGDGSGKLLTAAPGGVGRQGASHKGHWLWVAECQANATR
jgi:hypothetical protein